MIWHLPLITAAALHAPAAPHTSQPPDTKSLVKVSLLARESQVKPGDTVHLAVVFDIASKWHIYWPGQNESGSPTNVTLTFPEGSGLTAGDITFPVPKRLLLSGDIIDYVHEDKAVLTIPVKVAADAKVGATFTVTANVEYLVCHESCIPGEATQKTTITIAEKTVRNDQHAKTFDKARDAQPKPQKDGFDAAATAKWEGEGGDTLVITAADAAVKQMTFYPSVGSAKLLDPIKSGQAKGNTLRLKFATGIQPVDGVVEIGSGNTAKAWSFRIKRPQAPGDTPKGPDKAPPEKPISPPTHPPKNPPVL